MNMMHFRKHFKLLRWNVLAALLVGLVGLQGLLAPSAQAMSNATHNLSNVQAAITMAQSDTETQSKRLEAVKGCLPEQVAGKNKDVQERIARVFGEWGNEQFERIFDLTDNPELSDAEIQFERCLKEKGFTPQRKLQNS